ncbi:hypothetical protein tb265_34320 [Gemmatimonadetes bacterium T265]|nr:hypothetical protein tb265_34320 [Gemmatimonadetes bacterium T265]
MRSAAFRCAVPFALAMVAACASGGGRRGGAAAPRVYVDSEVVQVQVKSDYVGPLDVYLVSEGVASRLGDVNGPAAQTFIIDPSQFDINDIRIVAVPIGGYGRANSGRLNVRRGNIVQFNIAPSLRQSAVFIR